MSLPGQKQVAFYMDAPAGLVRADTFSMKAKDNLIATPVPLILSKSNATKSAIHHTRSHEDVIPTIRNRGM